MKVYQAINAVQKALSHEGIAKDRTASGFGAGYAFRGIDDVYNTLSPLLAEHGLVILPRCVERHESIRESGPKKLYFVVVRMEFDFVSSEDGSQHTASIYGEAMDSGDKATNKAMSIAYKYACFQTFAIPTEGDNDPDATIHEPASTKAKPQQKQTNQPAGQSKPPAQNNGQQIKPVATILGEIQKASDVNGLCSIRDYVATHQYTDGDIGEIKTALKSRHEAITHTQPAQAADDITPAQTVIQDIKLAVNMQKLDKIEDYLEKTGHGEQGYSEFDYAAIQRALTAKRNQFAAYQRISGQQTSNSDLNDEIPF